MPYRWDDDYGARLGVLRRDDPFGEVRWFDIDPCYVFHVANAYDDGRFALCCRRFAIPNCGATTRRYSTPTAVMWSWTIDLQTGHGRASASSMTAPWSSPASTTGWPGCPPGTPQCQPSGGATYARNLVRYDLDRRHVSRSTASAPTASPGSPGEAVFVPAGVRAADETGRLVPGLRLRPRPRRQRPGHRRRVGLHRLNPCARAPTTARTARIPRQLDHGVTLHKVLIGSVVCHAIFCHQLVRETQTPLMRDDNGH